MKSFFILLLTASLSLGAITMVQVERLQDEQDQTYFKVTAWGLKEDGSSKSWDFRTTGLRAKCDNIENCALFNLNRKATRYIAYFGADGSPIKIDFHLEGKFESKVFPTIDSPEFDEQSLIRIKEAKDYLEGLQ